MANNDNNLITPADPLTGIIQAPPLTRDNKKKRRKSYAKQNNKLKQSSDEPKDQMHEKSKTMVSKGNSNIMDYLA